MSPQVKKSQSTTTTTAEESKVLTPEQQKELSAAKAEHKARNAKAETVTFHAKDGSEAKVNVHRRLKTALEIVREIDGKKFVETYPAAADTKDVFEAIRVSSKPFEEKSNGPKAPTGDAKITKAHAGSALTAARAPLALAWKAIDGQATDFGTGPQGYIAACQKAITRLYQAQELARRMAEQGK